MTSGAEHRLPKSAWALVVAAYGGVAVVVTYPLVRQLGTALPGQPGDAGFYLWCMDTFWTSVRAGTSPFVTDRILHPVGANLAHSSCAPSLSFLALPFLSHLILFADVVTLVSLVAAAVGMALLVRALTGDDAVSVVAGFLYGFGPIPVSFLRGSAFPHVTAGALLPFGILALVTFVRTGRPGPLLGLSAIAWVIAFTQVYTTAAFLLIVAVMAAILLPGRVTRAHLRWLLAFGAANLVVAWIVVRFVFAAVDASDIPHGAATSKAVVNLADLVIPSESNPQLGWMSTRWASDGRNGEINSYFLGWGVLVLALGAIARRWRTREVIALAAAGIVVLAVACGTAIQLGGTVLASGTWTPFYWLSRLPFLELLDSPRRLVIGVAVAVIALAGVGLASLAAWSRHRRVVVTLAVALFALEYAQLGLMTSEIPVPAIYTRLASEPAPRAVLEMGGGLAGSNSFFGLDWSTSSSSLMYWQTVHRKPRIGGYIARIPHSTNAWFHQQPILADLYTMAQGGAGKWSGKQYSPEEVEQFIRTFDLGYVIIPPYPRQAEYASVITELLAGRIARTERDDKGYLLYVMTADPARPG